MGIVYICGDVHGKADDLGKVVQSAESKGAAAIIQVGDFAYGFSDDEWEPYFTKRARQGWSVPIYTCFGNHDNWDKADLLVQANPGADKIELYPDAGIYFVPRGRHLEIDNVSYLFLGGAESTDQHRRKKGLNWWEREQPSSQEFEEFFQALEVIKPDTIITHDAPLRVELFRMGRNKSYTPNMLESVLKNSNHQPRRWYFGHHHLLRKWKIGRTKFFCCGLAGQYWQREEFSDE